MSAFLQTIHGGTRNKITFLSPIICFWFLNACVLSILLQQDVIVVNASQRRKPIESVQQRPRYAIQSTSRNDHFSWNFMIISQNFQVRLLFIMKELMLRGKLKRLVLINSLISPHFSIMEISVPEVESYLEGSFNRTKVAEAKPV